MSSKRFTSDGVKVIGAGFGRTGTLSFKKAMEILGMPCYHMVEVFRLGDSKFWSKVSDNIKDDFNLHEEMHEVLGGRGYEATSDFPTATYYKQQLELYPEAKVILTVRDPEKWYDSCMETFFAMQLDHDRCPMGVRVAKRLGLPTPGVAEMHHKVLTCDTFGGDYSKANVIRLFLEHIEDVKRHVPPERLLVMDITKGDGWDPICSFLGLPVPSVPFPHVNDTEAFQARARRTQVSGLVAGVLCLGLPFLYELLVMQKQCKINVAPPTEAELGKSSPDGEVSQAGAPKGKHAYDEDCVSTAKSHFSTLQSLEQP